MAEKIRKREEIDAKYKWDLTHIFESDEAWEKEYDRVSGLVGQAAAWDGRVREDPRAAIRAVHELMDQILPLYEYAFLRKETDNGDPAAQGLKDRALRLYVGASTAVSFLEPELLDIRTSTRS